MFEAIIEAIEHEIMYVSWHSLVGLAIACTPTGLIILLYGLGMARVAAGTIGGFTGCFIAYILFGPSTLILGIFTIIGVAIGMALESALVALVGYATLVYNLTFAIVSAVSGTALVFLGIISLIRLDNEDATKYLSSHQSLCLVATLVMITLGTIEQLVFCKRRTKASPKSKAAIPQIDIEPSPRALWRTK